MSTQVQGSIAKSYPARVKSSSYRSGKIRITFNPHSEETRLKAKNFRSWPAASWPAEELSHTNQSKQVIRFHRCPFSKPCAPICRLNRVKNNEEKPPNTAAQSHHTNGSGA
ncbi:hypothetical protein MCOR02_004640 [Pyricularia oryzae]|uniref:Uncharacterized protein n=1 Tax=Pyricularia oryzae TaxID=318829 RepID=A0A4P7N243_PYROR|nr:hypothetical protein MCOR02_004640 [Pyricularia oryzae]KAI6515753.1 hypothetical protein MCOR10_008027 [Pyricularia oryzae]QBZ53964.1 hypothetical protein PoMZ_09654 [Pyricularia oryzae]